MHEPKRSFECQPEDWPRLALNKFVERVTTRNDERNDNVLTISAQHGLVSQKDFFDRRVASDNVANYYLLQRGDFAYNKSYSRGYPFGVVRRLDLYSKGVLSPLYICFRPDSEVADSNFLLHYFEAGVLDEGLGLVAKEGIRNHGLLNVGISDFFGLEVKLPAVPEQRQIAAILDTIDHAIRKTEQIIAKLKEVKQGLLHDLLTRGIDDNGELRDPERHPDLFKYSALGRIPREWGAATLGEYCRARQGLQIPISHRFDTPAAGRSLYITIKLLNAGFDPSIAEYVANPSPRVSCVEDDVLVSRTGATGTIVTNVAGAFHNNFFAVDFDRTRMCRDYIVAYLRSPTMHERMLAAAGTTTIPDLNHGDFYSLPLALPPIEEQRRIAQVSEVLSRRLDDECAQLRKLRLLKQGLMEDLLIGRVRVTPLLEGAAR